MASFLLALNLIIPMLVYMAAGVAARKGRIMQEQAFKQLNEMVFRIMLPLSLFLDIYQADLSSIVQPRLFLLLAAAILLIFGAAWWLVPRFVPNRSDAATIVQGIYRSNFVLYASAISRSLCGEAGAAVTAALAVMVVPLFNIMAVILFESMRGGKTDLRRLLLRILQNPLVEAGILGATANLFGIRIPSLLVTPLNVLGNAATPIALLVLGGLLSWNSLASHKGYLFVTVAFRLVVVPLLALPLFIALGYRNVELIAIFAAFATPMGISSTPMAQSMGGNGELAGEMVAVSAVCSVLTLFLFVWALAAMGYISSP